MQKLRTRFIGVVLAAMGLARAAGAQTVYTPVPVTGFTQDVIANGPGSVISSTTSDMDNGAVGNRFNFVSADFVSPTGATPVNALVTTGIINSLATPAITYKLGSYGANNSLRLTTTGSTGALTFTIPQSAGFVYLLGASGNGASTFTATVVFTDGTTQPFTGRTLADWFGGANPVIQGVGRVNYDSNALQSGTDPRLYEVPLNLLTTNYAKNIQRIDIVKTSTVGSLNILAVSIGSVCPSPPVGGVAAASVTRMCPGTSTSLSATGASAGASISYQWQASTDGGLTWTDIASANATAFSITPTITTQYRLRATCGGSSGTSTPVTVTVETRDVAALAYSGSPFCQISGATAAPVFSPAGGTFSSTPGLVLNATTGVVNLATSTAGTYTVTYTSAGFCPATTTATLTLMAAPAATLAYSGSPFCQIAGATVAPVFSPAGGTFSSTAGLVINASTGVINLVSSTAGTYTVTYTSAGLCRATATATLTLAAAPAATIAYSGSSYCQAATNPVPTVSPAGGTFAGTPGLVVNATTGTVSLAQSAPGGHTVTYSLVGACATPASTTIYVEATAAPVFYNVITPNGDTKNDYLTVSLPSVTGYEMQVYSRWGKRVWQSTNPNERWSAEGNSAGVYYYWVRFTDCSGQTQTHRSWVEVIK